MGRGEMFSRSFSSVLGEIFNKAQNLKLECATLLVSRETNDFMCILNWDK